MPDETPYPSRRPWTLWLIGLIMILVGGYNLLLALDNVRRAGYYRDLGVSYPPLLRATTALAWGLGFVALGIALVRRHQRARRWTWVLVSNYGAFHVLWLIVFARSGFGRDRITFEAALAAATVVLAAWVMRWRRVRRAFEPRTGLY
jgi:uncharacterized SAM-binding protein YcdF (DUF218 family)